MQVSVKDVDRVKSAVNAANSIAKLVSKTAGRTSLTRMTQDSIFQFPVIISGSIEDDEKIIIAKAFEKQCAAMAISAISLNSAVDINKYDSAAEYLRNFHSNKDIPQSIKAATNFVLESATEIPAGENGAALTAACWNIASEKVNMSTLNDVYKPYDQTKAALKNRIDMVKATEAVDFQKVSDAGKKADAIMGDTKGNVSGKHFSAMEKQPDAVKLLDNTNKSMEPIMVQANLTFHGNGNSWNQSIVIGIKSMVRIVRSDLLVANMIEMCKGSNIIFKFIKWAEGETKFFRDIVLGVSAAKEDAIADRTSKKWLAVLKRRKNSDLFGRFVANRIPPNTMIVITAYEANQIADACGVNLYQVMSAIKVVSNYYLLAFGIYDTETKILSTLFDGETDFASVSMTSMKSGNAKNTDYLNTKDVLKLMGRI